MELSIGLARLEEMEMGKYYFKACKIKKLFSLKGPHQVGGGHQRVAAALCPWTAGPGAQDHIVDLAGAPC